MLAHHGPRILDAALMPFPPARSVSIYVGAVGYFLLLSALCHIFLPRQTKYWLTKPVIVRLVGAFLLLLSLPCLVWRGSYFWILFAGLAISGLWRLFFPQHSIRAQEKSYPRWVHGCLMLAAATAVWALRP
jgi:hypothetical protein